MSATRRNLLCAAGILLAALAAYGDLLSADRLPLANDLIGDFSHWRLHLARSLQAGSIPEWNPYAFCGTPFIAAAQTAVWYPPNLLLYRLLPLTAALTGELFLHLWWFALGTAGFVRLTGGSVTAALLAGMLALLSPAAVTELAEGHLAQLAVLAWLPWALLGAELAWRKAGVPALLLLAAALAAALLAGHPQFTFYVWLAALLWFVLRGITRGARRGFVRAAATFAGAALLGLALGAAQLLPSLEVAPYLTRAAPDFAFTTRFDPPPETWLGLLLPVVPDGSVPLAGAIAWWGGAWVLVLLAWRRDDPVARALALLGMLALLLAGGRYSPLFWAAFQHVPGFALFRVPLRFICVFYFALSVLAARGFDRVAADGLPQGRPLLLLTLALLLLAVAAWGAGLLPPAALAVALNAAGVVAVLWLRKEVWQVRGAVWAAVVLGLVLMPAVWHMRQQRVVMGVRWLTTPSLLTQHLAERAYGSRYLALEEVPLARFTQLPLYNRGTDFRLRHCGGSDAVALRSYQGLFNLTQGRAPAQRALVFNAARADHPLLDRLAVRYVIAVKPPAGCTVAVPPGTLDAVAGLYERPTAHGLFRLAEQVEWLDPDMMETRLPQALRDGSTLAEPCGEAVAPPQPDDRLSDATFGAGRARVRTHLRYPRLLVYAESYYPGWQASIDDVSARVLRVDSGLMGVVVPGGRHVVQLQFRSTGVRRGLQFSLTALLVWLLLAAHAAWQALRAAWRDRQWSR